MVANVLVTDDRVVAIKKTISGICDVAICVAVPGEVLVYALRQDVLYVLSRRKDLDAARKIAGVSVFSTETGEKKILTDLEKAFGSVMTDYEMFYESDGDDDDRESFEIGMV